MAYYDDDPERREAKAAGVAMILAGDSVREVAQAVGLPRSTLQYAVNKLREGAAQDDALKRADQAVMASTYELANETQQRILEQLRANALENRDVIQASNVALKALSAFRRWQKPEDAPADTAASARILDRLEHALAAGAELTLSVSGPKPDHRAIDVEPVK